MKSKQLLQLFLLIKFTTTFAITSFSSVRLSAIINVRATSVLSAIRLLPAQNSYQLFQFRIALFRQGFIDGIAFHQIFFQHLVCPNAELCATLAFYTIAYGDDDIQRIKSNRLLNAINTLCFLIVFSSRSNKLAI